MAMCMAKAVITTSLMPVMAHNKTARAPRARAFLLFVNDKTANECKRSELTLVKHFGLLGGNHLKERLELKLAGHGITDRLMGFLGHMGRDQFWRTGCLGQQDRKSVV